MGASFWNIHHLGANAYCLASTPRSRAEGAVVGRRECLRCETQYRAVASPTMRRHSSHPPHLPSHSVDGLGRSHFWPVARSCTQNLGISTASINNSPTTPIPREFLPPIRHLVARWPSCSRLCIGDECRDGISEASMVLLWALPNSHPCRGKQMEKTLNRLGVCGSRRLRRPPRATRRHVSRGCFYIRTGMCVEEQPDVGLDPIVNLKSTSSRCLTLWRSSLCYRPPFTLTANLAVVRPTSQSLLASFGMSCMHRSWPGKRMTDSSWSRLLAIAFSHGHGLFRCHVWSRFAPVSAPRLRAQGSPGWGFSREPRWRLRIPYNSSSLYHGLQVWQCANRESAGFFSVLGKRRTIGSTLPPWPPAAEHVNGPGARQATHGQR